MHRLRAAFAATLAATALAVAGCLADDDPSDVVPAGQADQTGQNPQTPPMTSVLAGKKFTPPFKGQAVVEYTSPVTKRVKDAVVTTIMVKNLATAPLARLTIEQIWYNKEQSVVMRGRGVINGLLPPAEVQMITIEIPYNSNMISNNYQFSHANGTIKPQRVAKLEVPKTPATTPAATTKK
jgi:hypothetical protein